MLVWRAFFVSGGYVWAKVGAYCFMVVLKAHRLCIRPFVCRNVIVFLNREVKLYPSRRASATKSCDRFG
jgi:heme exporter protein D